MSQGPETQTTVQESFDSASTYERNLKRLNAMINAGLSWSGHERNCVFLNLANEKFATISSLSGIDFQDDGRAHALVDWDYDGDVDLWSTNRTAPQVRFLRNDYPTDANFLALRLVGNGVTTACDAIGARVEVICPDETPTHLADQSSNASPKQPPKRRIKTLRAGEGFLGQSSKWLHFGLGDQTKIKRVIVHWPAGEPQQFTGLSPNGFYRLDQKTGQATPWSPSLRAPRVHPADSVAQNPVGGRTAEDSVSATLLAHRFPLPPISYQSDSGLTRQVASLYGSPLLINLWSPNCLPCISELKELTARSDQLKSRGLQVLALSARQDQHQSDIDDQAKQILQKLEYPFLAGRAPRATVEQLQQVQQVPFSLKMDLRVPTSLLVDAQGRLAAIYRGRVNLDRLLEDVDRLPLKGDALLNAASSLPGRWFFSPKGYTTFNMAVTLVAQGDPEVARAYLTRHWPAVKQSPQAANLVGRLGVRYLELKQFPRAEQQLRRALQLDPQLSAARTLLAVTLQAQGQSDAALAELQRAANDDPQDANTQAVLGAALLSRGQSEAGMACFAQAVALAPRNARVRQKYIQALEQRGQSQEALPHRMALLRFSSQPLAEHQKVLKVLRQQGRLEELIQTLRATVETHPGHVESLRELAWWLATAPNPDLRRSEEALFYAQTAVEMGGGKESGLLDTLAVAYAAARRYTQAAELTEQALKLAPSSDKAALQRRLELYRSGKPFVQSPKSNPEVAEPKQNSSAS